MTNLANTLLFLFFILNIALSAKGYYECRYKKNAYGETRFLYPLSMFVWGDAFIFGVFFALSSLVCILLQDQILFLLILSLFYLVRSVGETIYWFNQQFSTIIRMKPEKYPTHKIFHNDSVWFIMQIVNQCVTVVTIITSVYLFHIWLKLH